MVTLSLKEFLRTGILGPVQLGMLRAQLLNVLGEPEHIGGTSRKHHQPTILKYGDLEFLFPPGEDCLQTIHMDGFTRPRGSTAVVLDPWIIVGGASLDGTEQALMEAAIEFTKQDVPYDTGMVVLRTTSGVELGFVREPDEEYNLGLYYISKRS